MWRSKVDVYAIRDPRNQEIRYVGQSQWVAERINQHLREAKKGNEHPLYRWLAELLDAGVKPEFVILEEDVPNDDRLEAENVWALYFFDRGAKLLNRTVIDRPYTVVKWQGDSPVYSKEEDVA